MVDPSKLSAEIQSMAQSLGKDLQGSMFSSISEAQASIQSELAQVEMIQDVNADAIRGGLGIDVGNMDALGAMKGTAEEIAGGSIESIGSASLLDDIRDTIKDITPDLPEVSLEDTFSVAKMGTKMSLTGGLGGFEDLGLGSIGGGIGEIGSGGSGLNPFRGDLFARSGDLLDSSYIMDQVKDIVSTLQERGLDFIDDGRDEAMSMIASIGEHRSRSTGLAA